MKKHARTNLSDFARGWSKASVLHQLPLILVDLAYIWYLCIRVDDTTHFLCVTILMVIHADLYLLTMRTPCNARFSLPYLVAQSLLLLAIGFLSGMGVIVLGLYIALMVKTVELLENAEPGPGPALAYLLPFVAAFGLDIFQSRQDQSSLDGMNFLPFLLCLAGSLFLFLRLAHARRCMQRLLYNLGTGYDELFAAHTVLNTRYTQMEACVAEVEEAAQVDERQRIARELHDTVTQDLVSLILQLEAIDARLSSEQPQRAREIAQLATRQARAALNETRQVICDLRTQRRVQSDLTQSLRTEMRRFSQTTSILCHCDLRSFAMLPDCTGEQILLAIKEGLTNVARHAYAREVWVDLRNSGTTCMLEIRDDGQGFDPTCTAAGHYGLLGLRERVQQFGGELQIQSAPGKGTRLSMSLPYGREEWEVCAV